VTFRDIGGVFKRSYHGHWQKNNVRNLSYAEAISAISKLPAVNQLNPGLSQSASGTEAIRWQNLMGD
jgi:hypothetical protein